MKKTLASIALTLACAISAEAERVTYASFDFNNGIPPSCTVTNRDNLPLHFFMEQSGFTQGDAWVAFKDNDAQVAASPSMLDDGSAQSDKELAFPEVFVRCDDATLTFRTKSINEQSKKNSCSYSVVAIEGQERTPIASGTAPVNKWEEVTISLEQYAGKKAAFAIVNTSAGTSEILAVDDVTFSGSPGLAKIEYLPGPYAYGYNEFTPGIRITATSPTPITSVKFTCSNPDGYMLLAPQDFNFTLNEGESAELLASDVVHVPMGQSLDYMMTVEINGKEYDQAILNTTVMLFETTKRVVLEEQTGTWCGWCPLGIVATDSLKAIYGDSIIPIAVHVGDDPMRNAKYEELLGRGAVAPIGWFDRTEWVNDPMVKVKVGREEKYTMTGGFGDAMERALARTAPADIDIDVQKMGLYSLQLHCDVTFAVNRDNANYKLACVLVEENVKKANYLQTNYLSGRTENAPVGGYDTMDQYITGATFNHVARWTEEYVEGGKLGRIIPSTIEAGNTYTFDGFLTIPNGVNPDNCGVVFMLVNASTGAVENANSMTFYKPQDDIETVTSESTADTPAFDLQGHRINASSPRSLYIKDGRICAPRR